MIHLINREGPFIPGGYPFTDPRTGMKFNGMEQTFYGQVSKIQRHRLANPNIYPRTETGFLDTNSIATQLDQFQCNRLGNNPQFCTDGAMAATRPGRDLRTQPSTEICPRCGAHLLAVGCSTCASFRIQSYRCGKCGFTRPR